MTSADLLSFGPYLLDGQARRLTRDGDEVVLGRRHFDLLWLLASHPDEVLSKDRLADAVWQGLAVTSN